MTVRGWCPGLLDPMPSGDGLLVRVKPPAGLLPAAAARIVADGAERYGNGVVELTGRGKLQLRGLRPDGVAPLADAMIEAGLACPDPVAEARRSVMACPLAPDADVLPRVIEQALADSGLQGLPAKFAVRVDGTGLLPLDGIGGDIRVRAVPGGALVWLDGAAAGCCTTEPARSVLRLSSAFATLRGPHRRVRDLAPGLVYAAAGLVPDAAVPDSAGPVRPVGPWHGAVGLGLPFGQMEADGLRALADLADRFADGVLRLSPHRAVLLAVVGDSAALRQAAAGWIVDPGDVRLRVAACPGQPGCASATVPARHDAGELAGLIGPGSLHVSGCAKGCAHPGAAAVTLVGRDGRYDLVRHGRAGDRPALHGLTLAQAAAFLRPA